MVWYLLLAHFIADYPLQPTWIVQNKRHFWVLLLHVSIHFVVMLAVTLPAGVQIWPYLLLIAAIHFAIDTAKNTVSKLRPRWIKWPYLIDQLCHWISIGLVSQIMPLAAQADRVWLDQSAAVYLLGFLLATYVWWITERILVGGRLSGRQETDIQGGPRMVIRAALLALLLLGWQMAAAAAATALVQKLPYRADRGGLRALIIDLLVSTAAAVLVAGAVR